MLLNTRHVGFVVNDIERFISFYQGFGLKLVSRMIEEGQYIDNLVGLKNVKLECAKLRLPDNSMIEILKYHSHPMAKKHQKQEANLPGCSHVALTVKNIKEAVEYIESSGGAMDRIYQISPDSKVKVVYCHDFEGNILEIVEELKSVDNS